MKNPIKGAVHLFLLGMVGGLLGEGTLYMRAHCLQVEALLMEDFRAIVFLAPDVSDQHRKVIQEKVLALPQTASVQFISPQESLDEIEASEPGLTGAVALLGGNPLPGAFEVEFEGAGLSDIAAWRDSVAEFQEVRDIRYKELEVAAILNVRFFARLLTMVMWLAFLSWGMGVVAFIVLTGLEVSEIERALGPPGQLSQRVFSTGTGTAAGILLTYVLAAPMLPDSALNTWPSLGPQVLLLAGGALIGVFIHGPVFGARSPVMGRGGKSRNGARLVAAALLVSLLSPGSVVFAARLDSKKGELKRVKKALQEKKKALEMRRREELKIRRDLDAIKRDEEAAKGELRNLEVHRAKKEQEWVKLDRELRSLDTSRRAGLETLSDEVGRYRRTRASSGDYFGREDIWREAFARGAIREKTVYLARLGVVREGVSVNHQRLDNAGRILRAKTQRTLSDIVRQKQRMSRTEKYYADARKRTMAIRKHIEELEESAKAIASLISTLQAKNKGPYKGAAQAPSFPPHSRPWPVEGRVVSTFGKKRVPELKTWVINNGIEIASAPGNAVRPIAVGEVIYAGDFRSYGNVVIVDHGQGFVSIYGQLGTIRQKSGDHVTMEQTIASVGGSKAGEGMLYLEMRQGANALDPLEWLKEK